MRRVLFESLVAVVAAVLPVVASAQSWPDGGPVRTGLGTAVAVADADVLVGWPHYAPFTPMMPPELPGEIVVYRRGAAGAWAEADRLSAPDGTRDNRFGRALAAAGNRLVVGGTKQDDDQGGAYVFERDRNGQWRHVARLVPADTTGLQNFGRAVALAGDFAFVATVARDSARGIVDVFRRQGNGSWRHHSTLQPDSLAPNDFFGLALGAAGGVLVVGAPNRHSRTGAAFIYQYDAAANAWRQAVELAPSGEAETAGFGGAVAIHGGRVFVGAPTYGGGSGAVFVYARRANSGEWREAQRIVAFDGAAGDQFGIHLAVGGDELWIGAPFAARGEGRVYRTRFDETTGMSVGMTKEAADGLRRRDLFGYAVAAGPGLAAVSIANGDYGEGTVVIYERTADGAWHEAAKGKTEAVGLTAVTGRKVDCAGGKAATFDCQGMDLVAFLPVTAIGGGRGEETSDVWGWTDSTTGREYALVGRYGGTSFVDVTEPHNPRYLGWLPLHEGAQWNVWRDIKVYKSHAFIVSDGAGDHGMQVFDLTRLRNVRNAPVTFAETAHYPGIGSAHNVAINEETGFAYAVGVNSSGQTCGGGLHMIDIQEPARPSFAGCFADTTTGNRGTGYSHDAMCIVYRGPDAEHRGKEICFGSNENALSIADVTNKSNPVALSSASYPNVGYAHQGWITEDHAYFFMDDEGDELSGAVDRTRTLVWDVRDLDDPVMVKEFFGTTSASDHNLYVKGTTMYQSNYVAGLRVVDVSDPENPREIGYFDTVAGDNRPGFAGSWSNYPFFASGTVLVTSGREGLFILQRAQAPVP